MAIEVRLATHLRELAAGECSVTGCGGTVAEVLADLAPRCPGLLEAVSTAVDGLVVARPQVAVYLGDEDVRFLDGLETPVRDGDVVTVLPAISGGGCAGGALVLGAEVVAGAG